MKFDRRARSSVPRWAILLALTALAVGPIVAALPQVASAWSGNSTPEYSLSIVEGADTVPEDTLQHVSAEVSPKAQVIVSLIHDGLTVEQKSGEGGTWLSQVPQVGDVVKLESPNGVVRGTVVYDGLPSIAPTVCAGSANFSGQRTSGFTVEGAYYTAVPHPSYTAHRRGGMAQVKALAGSAFEGNFLTALALGETVYAVESLESSIQGGTFIYSSEYDRPVAACPVPPPPPPPPPPLALLGSVVKFARVSLHKLLRSGWTTHVSINQPGRIVEDLYRQGGTLPAYASSARSNGAKSHKRARHKPPAVLLARGSASAGAAGTYAVTLHPTAAGRRLLGHARSVKAVLIATLIANSGARLTISRQSLTLHR